MNDQIDQNSNMPTKQQEAIIVFHAFLFCMIPIVSILAFVGVMYLSLDEVFKYVVTEFNHWLIGGLICACFVFIIMALTRLNINYESDIDIRLHPEYTILWPSIIGLVSALILSSLHTVHPIGGLLLYSVLGLCCFAIFQASIHHGMLYCEESLKLYENHNEVNID